jgi:predicted MFS family arabinose efflux permease
LVLTDLTTGTGRFNLAQGILGTLMGIAVALGTGTIGFIVERYGDVTGFVVMAAGTSLAMVLLWALLPETKPAEYLD